MMPEYAKQIREDLTKPTDNPQWDALSYTTKFLWLGVAMGWWEWVDEKRNAPIPFPRKIFNLHYLKKGIKFAVLFAEAGIFDSVSIAMKSGWNKPATIGEYWFKNRTIRVIISDVDLDIED